MALSTFCHHHHLVPKHFHHLKWKLSAHVPEGGLWAPVNTSLVPTTPGLVCGGGVGPVKYSAVIEASLAPV